MDSETNLEWWGYLHKNGRYQVKRYLNNYSDIYDAKQSPFIKDAAGPFHARDREDALKITKNLIPK
jgi:hypothetical protein|tara:strand:+ start:378 stop:575 length:198 start_codon:yes stop_codon:yes gene_type:complete